MELPNIITDTPSTIELLIFEDEKIHLPFHIQCTPSKGYKIIVKRYKNNVIISKREISNSYRTDLKKLLKSQGIRIKNGKWIVTNDF